MKILFSTLIMLVLLSGCYETSRSVNRYTYSSPVQQTKSIEKIMDSAINLPISKVIFKWGPYTRVVSDGADGYIYIWEIQKQVKVPQERWVAPPYYTPRQQPRTVPGIAVELQKQKPRRVTEYTTRDTVQQRMFYTRSDKTIYHWKIQRR